MSIALLSGRETVDETPCKGRSEQPTAHASSLRKAVASTKGSERSYCWFRSSEAARMDEESLAHSRLDVTSSPG